METLNISTETKETFSSISNVFIDEYMTEANGDFVKIYIYLVRLFHGGCGFLISDIADHFNMTENDVIRAVKYWVRLDVLGFTYNSSDKISGIVLKELKATPVKKRKHDNIDITAVMRIPADDTEDVKPEDTAQQDKTVSRAEPEKKVAPEVREVPKKSQMTAKRLESASYDENLQEILSQAEAYFDRELAQRDINSFIYIQDNLGFSFELMEYLLEYCATQKKLSGAAVEKEAIEWYKRGYETREQAKEDIGQFRELYRSILTNLGIANRVSPTPSELKYITKWINDDLFTDEVIIEACKRANLSKPNSASFPYVNGILDKWKKFGVHTVGDIVKADNSRYYEKSRSKEIAEENDEFMRMAKKLMN